MQLRDALAAHFNRVITPEVATEILRAACVQPDRSHDPAKFGRQEYRGIVFQAERLADILEELKPLHQEHWLETEKHRHGIALNPDYDFLLAKERAGELLQFTARIDGALVGNLRWYIGLSCHTQTSFAEEDTLYLTPSARGAFTAVNFIRFSESALRSIGVHEIRADTKLVNNAGALLRRLHYKPVAMRFIKFLEG